MAKNEGKESKFGRRKFIGHVVREDPKIDLESTRPVEKRGLKTTSIDAELSLENIRRTSRKKINIKLIKKQPNKTHKPLRQAIPWKLLEREIKIDKERRKRRRDK